MMRIPILKLLFPLILFTAICDGVAARQRLNFNNDWAFHRGDVCGGEMPSTDDSDWIAVTIPHVMQLEKKHCGGNTIYDGVGWYRRHFTVGPEAAGKRIVISFEGVMTGCEVFLNGEKISEHHGGYLGFVTDITDRVRHGATNLLALRVDASDDPLTPPGKPQADMDFYYYSGIYRDVEMVVTDRTFITDPLQEEEFGGVFVRYPHVTEQSAKVEVTTSVRSLDEVHPHLTLVTLISDSDHRVVAADTVVADINNGGKAVVSQTLQVDTPRLWHPDDPYLYDVTSCVLSDGLLVDSVTTRCGIRNIAFDIAGGFSINGRPLYLRGANRHQAFPYIGDAAPNSMQERDVIRIRKGGFNAVRAAHYPHDPAFLDACDRHGLLVVECIPGWQFFNQDPLFSERVCEAGRQMIRRDRNHPSVILWETALNETRYPVSLAESLWHIAHSEYPGDQMYTSGDYFGHEQLAPYFDVLYKQVGSFPADGNVMTNSPDNLIAIRPLITREWGDGVGDKPRASINESGKELLRQCLSRISQLEGEGYFDWCMLDANPNMAGHFLWSFNDYTRGSQDETMYSGAVDLSRYPKPCYYMMQSMIPADSSAPMVYIASDNSADADSVITVFSNAEAVILYHDGVPVGQKTRVAQSTYYPNITARGGAPVYRFTLKGERKGTLRADALIDGIAVASHEANAPGEADHLAIEFATDGIDPIADGSDLIPVYVTVRDYNDTRITTAKIPVHFTVDGPAVIVGDTIGRLGINPQTPEGGMAFLFLRAGDTPGIVRLTAECPGLPPATASAEILPYRGRYVSSCAHRPFGGHEEDGVVIKPSTWQQRVLRRTPLEVVSVIADGDGCCNITDGDDRTWWISGSDRMPQSVVVDLGDAKWVTASRIMFQKDSSSYDHTVETSVDGISWTKLYDRECTGWDFKPMTVDRELRYLRVTFNSVSEGRPGLNEITLY